MKPNIVPVGTSEKLTVGSTVIAGGGAGAVVYITVQGGRGYTIGGVTRV